MFLLNAAKVLKPVLLLLAVGLTVSACYEYGPRYGHGGHYRTGYSPYVDYNRYHRRPPPRVKHRGPPRRYYNRRARPAYHRAAPRRYHQRRVHKRRVHQAPRRHVRKGNHGGNRRYVRKSRSDDRRYRGNRYGGNRYGGNRYRGRRGRAD